MVVVIVVVIVIMAAAVVAVAVAVVMAKETNEWNECLSAVHQFVPLIPPVSPLSLKRQASSFRPEA